MVGRTDNSRRAYETIVENGLLGRGYLLVYTHIFNHGPTTRNKLDAALCPGKANPWPSRRLVEMERMGVLAVVGQDESGPHRMDIWDVTCNLPVDLPKRVSLKVKVKREVVVLEGVLKEFLGEKVFADPRYYRLDEVVQRLRELVA